MHTIKQPSKILIGKNSIPEFNFPKKSLLITSPGAKKRGSISYLNFQPDLIFEEVEPNPSMETVEKIIKKFQNSDFSTIIGLGGGSVLDVAVDIRKTSKTFGDHFMIELSHKNNYSLWIPAGFAHGFLTLEKENIGFTKNPVSH